MSLPTEAKAELKEETKPRGDETNNQRVEELKRQALRANKGIAKDKPFSQ